VGLGSYGPHAVLFTVGRNHTVQQYDLNPEGTPMLVRNVQHMPATNTPPSPPRSDISRGISGETLLDRGASLDIPSGSEDEGEYMDPLRRLSRDPDELAEEGDILAPLSPVSSAASSRSSVKGHSKRKVPSYPTRYDRSSSSRLRPQSPGILSAGPHTPSTVFSSNSSQASGRRRQTSSRHRNEPPPTPQTPREYGAIHTLFPYVKERLKEVSFRPPRYPDGPRTPDFLRQELLRCIFSWDRGVDELVRYEISHHEPGSATAVLLAKWLGDLGADFATSMMGESMSSSDWMLLALSQVGGESQKKIGDAYVQRLLEIGDIHPAAAILLGLGENNEAIEIYVSRGKFLEAVILGCLVFPNDWQRISHLARLWGEQAIEQKDSHSTDLAVRCFACTSVESSEPWFSPAAKDAVYEAQMRILGPDLSPNPNSPSDVGSIGGGRRHLALPRLTTDFTKGKEPKPLRSAIGSAMDGKTPMVGYTPMDTSVPDGARGNRWAQEPMSSVTATPGGLTSRRLTSRDRARDPFSARPPPSTIKTRQDDNYLNLPSAGVQPSYGKSPNYMPSPAASAFSQEKISTRQRNMSRDRKPEPLHVDQDIYIDPGLPTGFTMSTADRTDTHSPAPYKMRPAPSPALTEASQRSKVSVVDQYGSSSHHRSESRQKGTRAPSRTRTPSESKVVSKRYIQPAKKSPSSPISMSPDDPLLQLSMYNRPLEVPETRHDESSDAEKFYRMASPTGSISTNRDMIASPTGSAAPRGRQRSSSRAATAKRGESVDVTRQQPSQSHRAESRARSPDRERGGRGRSRPADSGASRQSPGSPVSMRLGYDDQPRSAKPRDQSIGARVRARGTSASRTRESSSDRPRQSERSASTRPADDRRSESPARTASRTMSRTRRPSMPRLQTNFSDQGSASGTGTRRTHAAQELEARRRSLARRPSAPVIMHPNDIASPRYGEYDEQLLYAQPPLTHQSTVESARSTGRSVGSTSSNVQMGLPSNPKAMRQAEKMSSYQADDYEQYPPATAGLPLLSAAAFQPVRSASVPVERMQPQPSPRHVSRESTSSNNRSHSRMGSLTQMMTPPPPPPAAAVDEDASAILRESMISLPDVEGDMNYQPALLPELQHLNMTPNMNSSATSLGVINIGMATPEAMLPGGLSAAAYQPPVAASPTTSRRGRGSMSQGSDVNKTRGVSRRREQSQSRDQNRGMLRASPYESIPDPIPRGATAPPASEGLTLSATAFNPGPPLQGGLSTLGASAYNPGLPYNPATSPAPAQTTTGYRTPKEIARAAALAQQQQEGQQYMPQFGVNAERPAPAKGNMTGYKNPKELRANMPPNSFQQQGENSHQKFTGEPF
jgi:hypothetical protein